jgi:hypothetical protein
LHLAETLSIRVDKIRVFLVSRVMLRDPFFLLLVQFPVIDLVQRNGVVDDIDSTTPGKKHRCLPGSLQIA